MSISTQKPKSSSARRSTPPAAIGRKATTGQVFVKTGQAVFHSPLLLHPHRSELTNFLARGDLDDVLEKHTMSVLFYAPLAERIDWINAGVPGKFANFLICHSGVLEKYEALEALDLPRATFDRWIKKGAVFPASESEKILGFGALIGQVEAMVAENPDAKDFDARAWLSKWLTTPLPALGDKKPVEYLNTIAGQTLVSSMLARMAEGVYA